MSKKHSDDYLQKLERDREEFRKQFSFDIDKEPAFVRINIELEEKKYACGTR